MPFLTPPPVTVDWFRTEKFLNSHAYLLVYVRSLPSDDSWDGIGYHGYEIIILLNWIANEHYWICLANETTLDRCQFYQIEFNYNHLWWDAY